MARSSIAKFPVRWNITFPLLWSLLACAADHVQRPHSQVVSSTEGDTDSTASADRDSDGVPNTQDACVNVAEDRDGFTDQDGCPEEDNDRDHVVDLCDACPSEPETYNGMADEDGCPDRPSDDFAHPVHVFGAAPVLTLRFRQNSDRLEQVATQQEQVRQLLERLGGYQQVRVGVVGYASSQERARQGLASRRAHTAAKELSTAGFSAEAMEVHTGSGSSAIVGPTASVFVLAADGIELLAWRQNAYEWLNPPHEHPERQNAPPPDPRCPTRRGGAP